VRSPPLKERTVGLLGDDRLHDEIGTDRLAAPVASWPAGSLRRGARAHVPEGHLLVLAEPTGILGTLDPGDHILDPDEHLFLATPRTLRRRSLGATTYLVRTSPMPARQFSGRVDDLDITGAASPSASVAGTYRLRCVDPVALVDELSHRVDLTNPTALDHWIARQLLSGVRAAIRDAAELTPGGLGGLGPDSPTADQVRARVSDRLARTGLEITRVDDLEVRIEPGSSLPAELGWLSGSEPSAGAGTLRCPGCGVPALSGARYCGHCGTGVATSDCVSCGAGLGLGARFCTACGAPAPLA
jgi:hypothetical protein